MSNDTLHLNLAKCWQGTDPWLCFQATISIVTRSLGSDRDETTRHKGYVVIDARRSRSAISWHTEKPEGLATTSGASAIARKYIGSARVNSVNFGDDPNETSFAGIVVTVAKGDSGETQEYVIGVHTSTPPLLELANRSTSYLRWSEKGLFTAPKIPAPSLVHAIDHRDDSGLRYLVQSWLEGGTDLESHVAPTTTQTLPLYQREARDRVARRLKTLQKTLKQDESKVPTPEHVADTKRKTHLLQTWIHLVKPDLIEMVLGPGELGTDETIRIELDPDQTPGAQLNERFHELRRLEKSLEVGGLRVSRMRDQIEALRAVYHKLQGPSPLMEAETAALLADAGLASQKKTGVRGSNQDFKASLGRIFKSSDGATLHMGRSAVENDAIVKQAKSNDFWIHASGGVHGSHVVVSKKTLKSEVLPETTLREAAMLAIHFSSLSLSRSGEVYVTTRGQLRKAKGAPAGLWQIQRTQTVMVRYEESELAALFTREVRSGTLRHKQNSGDAG